jgi:hypothetical protein
VVSRGLWTDFHLQETSSFVAAVTISAAGTIFPLLAHVVLSSSMKSAGWDSGLKKRHPFLPKLRGAPSLATLPINISAFFTRPQSASISTRNYFHQRQIRFGELNRRDDHHCCQEPIMKLRPGCLDNKSPAING